MLEKDADNVKALYRSGVAHVELQDFETATKQLKRAAELDPKSAPTRKALVDLARRKLAAKAKAKATFRRRS